MNSSSIFPSPSRGEGGRRRRSGGGEKPYSPLIQKNAKILRHRMTEAEKKLWYFLRSKQLGVKFRRQQPIGPYIVDFACLEIKLIIEADGGQHQENPSDQSRDAFLSQEGYSILRFWNHDILQNIEGIGRCIAEHPLLTSPLKGEEHNRSTDERKNHA